LIHRKIGSGWRWDGLCTIWSLGSVRDSHLLLDSSSPDVFAWVRALGDHADMAVPTALEPTGPPSLTALAHGAGCGCKLAAADLLPIVRGLPFRTDERLLVGSATSDDAAVFELREDLALVQTVDFFTPLVDDPYDYGRIAAANALSDVYAMGGKPLTAMNIVAFPLEKLGGGVLREILRGGLDVVSSAGAVLVGGHSIDDNEPKYGLAVTGIVNPTRITTNAAGRPGDMLVLTKPLGVGAIVTAAKHGHVPQELLAAAIEVMVTLNDAAAEAALSAGVRAMTDVTGFGLLGHLHHLCRESGLSAEVDAASVPAIAGVEVLLDSGKGVSGGSRRNAEWATTFASIGSHVEGWRARLLTDATTSGGLLAAVPTCSTGVPFGSVIGRLCAGPAGAIMVR
jgi:selenide, water dikinase